MLYKIKRIEIVYMDRIYISNNIKSFIYAIQPESIFSFSKMSRELLLMKAEYHSEAWVLTSYTNRKRTAF